ncbi:glycoside hydrolase N-terminal domain-containing protein [Micromonospora sp. NPDC047740]|uniref:glycosyl hydrolase family 95 catalytic domain-containing protein n=1 Tax=Micromonospora sp. NPDC047740 TaxID=3364254 RepID=UPI0037134259
MIHRADNRRAGLAGLLGAVLCAAIGLAAVPAKAGTAALAPAAPQAAPSHSNGMTLWYDKPATNWESQSLPIGNGALGAAVFGGVATEQLQFNEKTLWTGGPGSQQGYNYGNWTSPRPDALEEVQRRIEAEQRVSPSWVASKLGQPKSGFGAYQSFGDVRLSMIDAPTSITGYRRYLDISDATAGVTYTAGGVRYSREYFASAADSVLVARISADQPGAVAFTTSVTAPTNRSKSLSAKDGRITLSGRLNDNAMRFESQLQVVNIGGQRVDNPDGSITVTGADSVTLMLAAGTDYANAYPTYRGPDPHDAVTARVDTAAAKSFSALRTAHVTDYRALFDRVTLDVGQQMPAIPTDQLLNSYRDGSATPAARKALEVLFFQYGRYLLVASSRGGSLPANLQGVWNNSTSPPWSADYHVNINLQMNYWPAETTNLAETTDPLFDYVDGMVAPGQVTAREMFGNRGWVVHNETNPFGFTGVHDWATAFWFPEAAAWLAQHYYEHYLFTRDEAFLRDRAYPVMKQLAQFWMDELVVDPRDGRLVVSPSYSPEQGDFSAGASMSQQIIWDLLTNVSEAAAALGDETDFRAEVAQTLDRLDPGTRIGSWGQLQEWKADWDDPKNDHRHVSHLFGLHPGRQISPLSTPEYAKAAAVSLTARGDGGTGWSKAWKINFWARLLDGNHSHKMLSELLKNSVLTNLWDTHPPFQIDGNFGATAGVAEMLLQSQHGVVDVLPAVPDFWPDGSVTGLRARGDVTVDADWTGGAATRIAVHAGQAGPLRVRSSLFSGRFQVVDATTGKKIDINRDGQEISFDAVAGHRYVAVSLAIMDVRAPAKVEDGQEFPADVTVSAPDKTVPAGELTLRLPEGWTYQPARVKVLPIQAGESRTYTFQVTPIAGSRTNEPVRAVLTGDGWQAAAVTQVEIDLPPPCAVPPANQPLVAWNPTSGSTVGDTSTYHRDATVQGTATYDSAGPTGSAMVFDGNTYWRTSPTSLGFLKEATFAAEVKVTTSGSYRRLFDFQPSGNPGTDGVLIDLTPSNQVRFIGSGRNVTTTATVPTGRYLNLVIVMARTGVITVYIDGAVAGSAQVPQDGINGCATRQLRFGADQNGGQRLTGAVDRAAIFPRVLTADEVTRWQAGAFD